MSNNELMMIKTDMFDRSLRDAAMMEARPKCREGWAMLSEEELAKALYEFAKKICGDVMDANQRLLNCLADSQKSKLMEILIKPAEVSHAR